MADAASAGEPGAAPPLAYGFLTRVSGAAVLPSLCLCLFPSLFPNPMVSGFPKSPCGLRFSQYVGLGDQTSSMVVASKLSPEEATPAADAVTSAVFSWSGRLESPPRFKE